MLSRSVVLSSRQKDGIDLHDDDDKTQALQDDQGFCRLQIRDVKPEDSGLYACVAKNDNGTSKSVANLRVRGLSQEEIWGWVEKLSDPI